ncbi:MAG: Holliday junction resolvase-like protein [Candidatus Aenigmarchaeota archaeon]|nr:Holliday junction resolvase [Candidatus Aenigmarchaeota archaeon]MCX8190620.1 Holliday junction resolvase [Candidatus Aenigmarchaeota archaeon]MDW8160163.1 Holliday junction resolvase-like protein [Candidatus Aenigmarchaeota archaeon]
MFELFLITILFIFIIYLFLKNLEWKFKFEERVKKYIEEMEEKIRRDAIERSSKILSGKIVEKLVPITKDFNHNPHDVRWLGDPVDFVVFDGLSEGNLKKITFVEVKSGKSPLNENEKMVRDVVKKKEIEWEEFRI